MPPSRSEKDLKELHEKLEAVQHQVKGIIENYAKVNLHVENSEKRYLQIDDIKKDIRSLEDNVKGIEKLLEGDLGRDGFVSTTINSLEELKDSARDISAIKSFLWVSATILGALSVVISIIVGVLKYLN